MGGSKKKRTGNSSKTRVTSIGSFTLKSRAKQRQRNVHAIDIGIGHSLTWDLRD